MRLSDLLFVLFRFLLPPAIISTLLLYFYAPLFDCTFPLATPAEASCHVPGQEKDAVPAEIAPFRLLAFGDPQLEGDTSLPDASAPAFPCLIELSKTFQDGRWSMLPSLLASTAAGLFTEDIPNILWGYRKRLDLWGNDLYLAHISRSVSWWSQPTHIVVLGDLLGSQWIGDDEFKLRSERFWNTVFKGMEKLPRSVTESSGRIETLGDDRSWQKRIIAVAGNHDIGYAGDVDEHRVERFEDMYGNVNWEIRFRLENTTVQAPPGFGFHTSPFQSSLPELHLVILNSMNLDAPAKHEDLQQQSRDFAAIQLDRPQASNSATVLLTHIPFHKEAGVCVDSTFFDWFSEHEGGGIKEQNHLHEATSGYLLSGLAGTSERRTAIVLSGHDHEGCDTYHYRAALNEGQPDSPWEAKHYNQARPNVANESLVGLREITVRSMMGSFGGNAGFLSGWFDYDVGEWKFEYNSCSLGVQHIWWAVHVFDLVVITLGVVSVVSLVVEELRAGLSGRDGQVKDKLKKS